MEWLLLANLFLMGGNCVHHVKRLMYTVNVIIITKSEPASSLCGIISPLWVRAWFMQINEAMAS